MSDFIKFVFTPAGFGDPALAIAGSRCGAVGVLNTELSGDPALMLSALDRLAAHAGGAFGVKLDELSPSLLAGLAPLVGRGLRWVIADEALIEPGAAWWAPLRAEGVKLVAEVLNADWTGPSLESLVDGVLVKGNESGGYVGENASFILVQHWLGRTALPIYLRGGMTPHVAAACAVAGVAGGALDSQLLLMDEVRLPEAFRALIGNLAGSETVAVGHAERGEYFRVLVRPSLAAARKFVTEGDGLGADELRAAVGRGLDWSQPARSLLPIGQDVAFAAEWRKRYGKLVSVLKAFDAALSHHAGVVAARPPITEGSALARSLNLRFPIVQGPMTRVSDTAEFALAVAEGGALPMIALALVKGRPLEELLERSAELLAGRSWGIGLLGFAPQALLDEQLGTAARFKPSYAIIAGGRPDQAVHLEQAGVPTFLHVPAAGLIGGFMQEGARRFIFEGRECGGHIGPLSSFVLWSSMVDRLLVELPAGKIDPTTVQVLFAGGIHDTVSSAMLQVLVAPLVELGVQIGILMGSAYLFTSEIVESRSIVEPFQKEVIACERTVNLESGPGHASRCAYTPFARDFFQKRVELKRDAVPPDEARHTLDDLILGRLRIASKGTKRSGLDAPLQVLSPEEQLAEGMYMLGQLVTLRDRVTSIGALHQEVSVGAAELLASSAVGTALAATGAMEGAADIAIVGLATLLPGAADSREYWENIVAKFDAITEIPAHRWDWRLYFDADRNAKDKIYSRWGGFLDDLAFDPTRYGMPPKSVTAVDPMQLMGLEVAYRTLLDAGYAGREFDREKASVILGASGGVGDYGMMYGLRSELPRFSGELPADVAERLPTWTEDSFAGILPNVVAGRIANRLNFGGINMTVDAACASSLAAVYHAVGELVAGRSDLVIAGGVDTVQGPFGYLCFSKTQALSPRGRCSTFDAEGDGIVISEGIAMVALKRLADARRDGDRVYAVIKGVGASSDGNAKGLTAPLPAGQLRAMRRAYAMAGFGPSAVGLFEAHGTGTVAGDTAELESTMRLMREEGAPARSAVIGSVKTNIGHTKATAGLAGMIKAALSLHRRVLPPHRNVQTPNAVLQDSTAPLYLLDEAIPWLAKSDKPRRASCSAFGFGGTNFHIVMEEDQGEFRDWLRPVAVERWSAELVVCSADDAQALAEQLGELAEGLAAAGPAPVELRDIAASAAARWTPREATAAIVARSVDDLRVKLDAAVARLKDASKPLPPGVSVATQPAAAGKVALLFPGQGSQYPGMGREAALHFEAVAGALAQADEVLAESFATRFGPASLLSDFIFPRGAYGDAGRAEAARRLTSTDVAQPALGALEVGLFRLMQQLGLRSDMMAGHSYGEFVALHAAGSIDYPALMALSAARGRFIVDAAQVDGAELGTMGAVNAPRKVVEEAIADIDGVIIANHNAPLQCIVSGTRAAVALATAKLAEAGVEVTPIPVAAAFHSSLVKPAQRPLSELIDSIPVAPLGQPVYSNTTSRPHTNDAARIKRQMSEHLVRPVEWVAEVEAMYEDGARIFVELGPKSVLTRLAGRILEGKPHVAVSVDDGSGLAGLLGGIGQLLCAGLPLNVMPLFAARDCRVGDPARPASLRPPLAVPKHAWMLNGSGARRLADPVQQVGVTLEQSLQRSAIQAAAPVAAALPPSPALPAAAPEAPPAPAALVPARPFTPQKSWRRSQLMDERPSMPGGSESPVMSEYFATMRHFLETQERVMSAYLGENMGARPALRARPMPAVLPRVMEVAPALAPAAAAPVPPKPVVVAAAPAPAPVVKPAPAPVPVAAPVAAAKPAAEPVARASAKVEAPAPAKAESAGLSRDKLIDMLMAIVEDKTGYPRDMVGLDQNLEADLGIDSIKRIEVIGNLMQVLPAGIREALKDSRSKLNTQPTLNGVVDLITQVGVGKETTVPFDRAGTGSTVAPASHLSRHVMRHELEPIDGSMAKIPLKGRFLVTEDSLGIAAALAQSLRERGCEVTLVPGDALSSEESVLELCRNQAAGPWAGLVHLAAVGAPGLKGDEGPESWRRVLLRHDKSFFLMVRELGRVMTETAHVMSVSGLGGLFGRAGTASPELQLQSGAVGALKSLQEERPTLKPKAVDVDPGQPPEEVAAQLVAELELDGGRIEVGYRAGARTIFRTVAETVTVDPVRNERLRNVVVLATGGARGITAEVLRELALPGNVLVLTGRSPMPPEDPPELAALSTAEALRQHLIAQVRAGRSKLTVGAIQREVQAILGRREMRSNLADFQASGAEVEYHAVDVTDAAAIRSLVDDVVSRRGGIDGVVHGAGVIEDKLLSDKTSESWSRVVETKVIGALLLQQHLDPARLRFFAVFSSVAGRYGNSGQSDYATANELMNRLCQSLQLRWGPSVAVASLCWGPWGPTKFGAGMVTAETESKFAEKGVVLVSATEGRRLFREEIAHAGTEPIEVICGQGPWEAREAEIGAVRRVAAGEWRGPLLGMCTVQPQSTGEQIVAFHVDPARHAYLKDHSFDGMMVLPAAVGLEMLSEAVRSLWPAWQVVQVHGFKLLKGIDFKSGARQLRVRVSPPPYGSSEGFDVNAELQTELAPGRWVANYRGVVRLGQHVTPGDPVARAAHGKADVSVDKVYDEWLCHGPAFQLMKSFSGLARSGAGVTVRTAAVADWVGATPDGAAGWVFEPGLIDVAAQMAWVWARAYRDETALPARFGLVHRFCTEWPAQVHMEYEQLPSDDPSVVRANVSFLDEKGNCLMLIEGLESIASAALNRFGGQVSKTRRETA